MYDHWRRSLRNEDSYDVQVTTVIKKSDQNNLIQSKRQIWERYCIYANIVKLVLNINTPFIA